MLVCFVCRNHAVALTVDWFVDEPWPMTTSSFRLSSRSFGTGPGGGFPLGLPDVGVVEEDWRRMRLRS
jgi:hypothetical protein